MPTVAAATVPRLRFAPPCRRGESSRFVFFFPLLSHPVVLRKAVGGVSALRRGEKKRKEIIPCEYIRLVEDGASI